MRFVLHYNDTGAPVLAGSSEPLTTATMRRARQYATDMATEANRAIRISTVDGETITPRIVIRPDGGAEPPQGVKAEPCTDGQGGGACFCRNCRARRRAR